MPLALTLLLLAVALTWAAPRALPRLTVLRRVPVPALLLWQACAAAAVVSALACLPVALVGLAGDPRQVPPPLLAAAAGITGWMAGCLLWSGHVTGRGLRAARARLRTAVDLVGATTGARPVGAGRDEPRVRIVEHPRPTAYCLPGRERRVVLSHAVLAALPPEEVAAVVAHERAHLRARHDLVLEFFTVVHGAAPGRVRSPGGLHEVSLLVELAADRAAVQRVGAPAVGRALVHLAGLGGAAVPPGLTHGPVGGQAAAVRLRHLDAADRPGHAVLRAVVVTAALLVAVLPLALTLAAAAGAMAAGSI